MHLLTLFLSKSCSCHSGVSVISLLWLCFLWKEMTTFERSFPQFLLPFFPPLFSHLICSSFCWTRLCPSPFLPYSFQLLHPPSTHNATSQHILYLHPPPLLLSFLMQHAKVYHSHGHPSSQHFHGQSVADTGQKQHSILAHAVVTVYMLMVSVFLRVLCQ